MTTKRKRKKHSEIWWAVFNSVRFCIVRDNFHNMNGIMIAERKKDLKDFKTGHQRIVRVKVTEL